MQLCPGLPVNKINKPLRKKKKMSVHAQISKTHSNYLAHFIFKVLCVSWVINPPNTSVRYVQQAPGKSKFVSQPGTNTLLWGLILDGGNAALKSITGSGGGYLFNGTHCKPLLLLFEVRGWDMKGWRKLSLDSLPHSRMSRRALEKTPGAHAALCLHICVWTLGTTRGQGDLPGLETLPHTSFGFAELKLLAFCLISCFRAEGKGSCPFPAVMFQQELEKASEMWMVKPLCARGVLSPLLCSLPNRGQFSALIFLPVALCVS